MATTRGKGNNGQGMNWITQHKRLAIYLRDGIACVYCSAGVEQETKLTLDHLVPRCKGGTNHESNLVTACLSCNSRRQDKSWRKFAGERLGFILNTTRRKLDTASAKSLIAARGNLRAAISTKESV